MVVNRLKGSDARARPGFSLDAAGRSADTLRTMTKRRGNNADSG